MRAQRSHKAQFKTPKRYHSCIEIAGSAEAGEQGHASAGGSHFRQGGGHFGQQGGRFGAGAWVLVSFFSVFVGECT